MNNNKVTIRFVISKKGIENKYLPANAIATANKIDKIITVDLTPLAIFLLEIFANQFKKMYAMTKRISVIIKIFIY